MRQPGVRIHLDRRASGRVVTVVTGVPGPKRALTELARALRAACGAGGTVGKDSFELQGDHRDAVEAALRARGLSPKRAGG
jgi:translation initiation factor 1